MEETVGRSRGLTGLLLSGKGLVALLVPAAVIVLLLTPWRVAALVVAALVALLYLWSAVSRRRWRKTVPPAAAYTRRSPPTGMRTMLRKDGNAGFSRDRWRFLWLSDERYWFAGTGCPPVALPRSEYRAAAEQQRELPVLVAADRDRRYWWWQDAFYWENEGYEPADVMAIVLQHQRGKERALQHAHDLMAAGRVPETRKREPIPESIRREVFRRDGGRCQECGSTELLQFDHVIPLALGGSSEAQNLQLLCADCNRKKGARI